MKKKWIDETGLEVPANRITAVEKLRENAANKMLRKALIVEAKLIQFKLSCTELCDEVWLESLKAAGANPEKISEHKGNHTWYNFDRTIKVEVSVNERLDFDDALIAAAKEKFDEYLDANTQGVDPFLRSLITDAFNTTRGKLDAKKIMQLIRHKSRVDAKKYPHFAEAVVLIEQSIRRPDSKKYFRIWMLNGEGEYRNIDLNFSSI